MAKWKEESSFFQFNLEVFVILFSVLHTSAASSLMFYIKISIVKDFVVLYKS